MTEPVTWVIPVRNGMPYIRETLASMAGQTYPRARVLAWDNGSTDGTVEELRRWVPGRLPGRVVTGRPMSLGRSLAAMVEAADTELIAVIHADDINEPDRLARQVEFMARRPGVGLLGTRVTLIDAAGRPLDEHWDLPTRDADLRWRLRFAASIVHPAVMLRRSVVLRAGNYPDLVGWEDYDLWLRMAMVAEVANLPERLVRYRRHAETVSSRVNPPGWRTVRDLVVDRYADRLFPGVGVEAVRRAHAQLVGPTDAPVTLDDLRTLRRMARSGASACGLGSDAFRRTELYRSQVRRLARRWLRRRSGLALASRWLGRRAA